MGRHEEFLYSKKYSPVEIAKFLMRGITFSEMNDNNVEVICKATIKRNISVNEVKIFGVTMDIKPIRIKKDTIGLIVSCPNFEEAYESLPFHVKLRTHCVRTETILFNTDINVKGLTYSDYFEDAKIEVNGKTYFSELKSIKKEK